jgi:nitrogen regulatory protein P-II 1
MGTHEQERRQSLVVATVSEATTMIRIEAIIQPSSFGAVKAVLAELGIGGMSVSGVRGHGSIQGHTEVYRGRRYNVELLPKLKLELVLPDHLADSAVEAIRRTTAPGSTDDGRIFASKM